MCRRSILSWGKLGGVEGSRHMRLMIYHISYIISLSLYLSIYISIHPSIHPSIYIQFGKQELSSVLVRKVCQKKKRTLGLVYSSLPPKLASKWASKWIVCLTDPMQTVPSVPAFVPPRLSHCETHYLVRLRHPAKVARTSAIWVFLYGLRYHGSWETWRFPWLNHPLPCFLGYRSFGPDWHTMNSTRVEPPNAIHRCGRGQGAEEVPRIGNSSFIPHPIENMWPVMTSHPAELSTRTWP